jgi:hypothetical protein
MSASNVLLLLDEYGTQYGQLRNNGESDWLETDRNVTLQASGGTVTYGVAVLGQNSGQQVII